jgi:hypothetical protein
MPQPPKEIKIRFTKQCVFRDLNGTVQKVYEPGDIILAYKCDNYYSTGMGGIWFDEAEEVELACTE